MKNSETTFSYNGYTCLVKYSEIDQVFYSKIEKIDDLVSFEADTIKNLEKEFIIAVDDYVAFCQDINKNLKKI